MCKPLCEKWKEYVKDIPKTKAFKQSQMEIANYQHDTYKKIKRRHGKK